MNSKFYASLRSFDRFDQLADSSLYTQAPEDWHVIITDIRGSTKAIQEGRYKTVNMVGAASLAAVFNALKTRDIPFVFGGDGATILVPEGQLDRIRAALAQTQKMSREMHGLELRIGIVPHRQILKEGSAVLVAKFALSKGNSIAFFRGSGLSLAEKWIKSGQYAIEASDLKSDFDPHAGLSCRWAPIASENGEIVSLLVKFIDDSKLQSVTREISEALDKQSSTANPVKPESLKSEGLITSSTLEASLSDGKWWTAFKHMLFLLMVRALDKGWLPKKMFDLEVYKQSVTRNSDFRKYDEVLRLVVDVSPDVKLKIEKLLDHHMAQGELIYGLHSSPTALMTCFVNDTQDDQHIHFIDGGDGGYAMAARDLKSRMK